MGILSRVKKQGSRVQGLVDLEGKNPDGKSINL